MSKEVLDESFPEPNTEVYETITKLGNRDKLIGRTTLGLHQYEHLDGSVRSYPELPTDKTAEEKLPFNKKRCPLCKKIKRTKCFHYNTKLDQFVCNSCNRSVGNNRWFVPKSKRTDRRIGRFSMSNEERKLKAKQLIAAGLTYQEAWKRVNYLGAALRTIGTKVKRYRTFQKQTIKKTENENTQRKKAFVEGLK